MLMTFSYGPACRAGTIASTYIAESRLPIRLYAFFLHHSTNLAAGAHIDMGLWRREN